MQPALICIPLLTTVRRERERETNEREYQRKTQSTEFSNLPALYFRLDYSRLATLVRLIRWKRGNVRERDFDGTRRNMERASGTECEFLSKRLLSDVE